MTATDPGDRPEPEWFRAIRTNKMSDETDNDRQAEFVGLLTAHQNLLQKFVLSLIPHSPDVEDVVQEINLILWKKRDEFESGTNFKAWALTVSRFQVMAYRKRMALRKVDRLTDEILDQLAEEIAQERPESASRNQRALAACFQKLDQPDRDLLLQRYWHRRPLRDFADFTGRSEQALKSQLHRLRETLRLCVRRSLTSA